MKTIVHLLKVYRQENHVIDFSKSFLTEEFDTLEQAEHRIQEMNENYAPFGNKRIACYAGTVEHTEE